MKRSVATIERREDGSILIIIDGDTHFLQASAGTEIPDEMIQGYVRHQLRHAQRQQRKRMQRGLEAIETWAALRKLSLSESEQAQPPRLAEAAFAWLAPSATVDTQLGDLQEIFANNAQRHGVRRARWLYWLEVMRSIGPAAYRISKRVGLIGLMIDYFRTKFGL